MHMIKFVLKERILQIIDHHIEKIDDPNDIGMFLSVDGNNYVAFDNSKGEAEPMLCNSMQEAIRWLKERKKVNV